MFIFRWFLPLNYLGVSHMFYRVSYMLGSHNIYRVSCMLGGAGFLPSTVLNLVKL